MAMVDAGLFMVIQHGNLGTLVTTSQCNGRMRKIFPSDYISRYRQQCAAAESPVVHGSESSAMILERIVGNDYRIVTAAQQCSVTM